MDVRDKEYLLRMERSRATLTPLRLLSHPQIVDGLRIILIGASLETTRRLCTWVYYKFQGIFYQTVRIDNQPMIDWLDCWLLSKDSWKDCHDVTASKNAGDDSLIFSASAGIDRWINYKGKWLKFVRDQREINSYNGPSTKESLTVSLFGFTWEPVKHVIREARELYKTKHMYSTQVLLGDQYGNWNQLTTKSHRPWHSFFLPGHTKDFLLNDAKEFMSSEEWFANRGIPFRRGYLLYGIPGTGKSTTVHALASELNLPIYILMLSLNLDDSSLADMMRYLPSHCVLLLEDIDVAFKSRVDNGNDRKENESSVTLSGLLNAIDGLAAPEGRLLFATTNHVEKLDPALIRPGRIDVKVEFKAIEYTEARALFINFHSNTEILADEFAATVSKYVVTPSQLQAYLLFHKSNPAGAVKNLQKWIEEENVQIKST
ncbi:P-loop containing nucleoside triphosphate hydrolase protein [Wallemia mellicola]|uniref:P-loop containing nucleoside triphosphate hydrolase protein n=1 Tax=Wallemia mellicola TaxID=1708541 RepID=A0A4T0P2W3_9BASI|nr:P-loop containing nucleoside triphosphate hydrolase protein [Wallemia mellicola]TIC03499.1 P-loop containing nucleoside triphosphate hydrolase protein [Wallemia mellicola]